MNEISYSDFTKYDSCRTPLLNMVYFNGMDLDTILIKDELIIPLGRYVSNHNCILDVKQDGTFIYTLTNGILEFNFDIYVELELEEGGTEDWADIVVELRNSDGLIKRIRDHKVGSGIHMMTFHAFVYVNRHENLYFTISSPDKGDVIVRCYNDENDVTFNGSVVLH